MSTDTRTSTLTYLRVHLRTYKRRLVHVRLNVLRVTLGTVVPPSYAYEDRPSASSYLVDVHELTGARATRQETVHELTLEISRSDLPSVTGVPLTERAMYGIYIRV